MSITDIEFSEDIERRDCRDCPFLTIRTNRYVCATEQVVYLNRVRIR